MPRQLVKTPPMQPLRLPALALLALEVTLQALEVTLQALALALLALLPSP